MHVKTGPLLGLASDSLSNICGVLWELYCMDLDPEDPSPNCLSHKGTRFNIFQWAHCYLASTRRTTQGYSDCTVKEMRS